MDLTSVNNIKILLQKYQTKPSKTMGQNFLIHRATLGKIIEAAGINSSDTILEVGPGVGTLTQELAKHAKKVIAIEKDKVMIDILKETLQSYQNIEVIQGDALTHNYSLPTALQTGRIGFANYASRLVYKLIANLPYYITSPIIRMFLEMKNKPEQMILMVQKEVAQRICAKPPNMSILAVSVQFYAQARIIAYVSKEKFWPSPKVDSAIIKITPFDRPEKISSEKFFLVVKSGFLHPRKQLANNFIVALKKSREEVNTWLQKNNIKPEQRAETLSIKDWIDLTNSY